MSGLPPEPAPDDPAFPPIGQYEVIPGPGDVGYEPPPDLVETTEEGGDLDGGDEGDGAELEQEGEGEFEGGEEGDGYEDDE